MLSYRTDSTRALHHSLLSTRIVSAGTWMLATCMLTLMLATVTAHAQEGEGDAAPQGPPPAQVRAGVAKLENLPQHFSVVGRLAEIRRTNLAVETTGRVVELNAEEGTQVVAGKTVLARIDDTWAKIDLQDAIAQVAQAKANIASAQATLDQSRRDLEYLQDLQQAGSAKPKEVADKRTEVESNQALLNAAKASLDVAQAILSRAQTSMDRLEIVAPFDGVVVDKLTEVGQWLDRGDAVAQIISRGQIDAMVDVPENIVTALSLGQQVEVRIDAIEQRVMGEIVAIVPLAASGARTFPVKVRLNDMQGRLKPGMSVFASMPIAQKREVLTVPRDAVQTTVQGQRVWVGMNQGGPMPAAIPVTVRVLFGSGDRFAIEPIGGQQLLKADTQVVVEGQERLFPTQPLIFITPDQPDKTNPNPATAAASTQPQAAAQQ